MEQIRCQQTLYFLHKCAVFMRAKKNQERASRIGETFEDVKPIKFIDEHSSATRQDQESTILSLRNRLSSFFAVFFGLNWPQLS